MNDMLQEAITGSPVTVKLGGETYPLAYPIQAVILYKRETALLDRERAKDRPRMTRELKREVRDHRHKLLAEADKLRPAKGEDWKPANFLEFDAAMDEASALKIALDEDAGTGDSLYDMYNWRKISPDGDPERLLLALWIGLHEFKSVGANMPAALVYLPRMSKTQVGQLVDLGNGGDLTMAISQALSAHLIAASEVPVNEEPLPNVRPPSPAVILQANPLAGPPEGMEERRKTHRQK